MTFGAVPPRGAFHAMPEFGYTDRGNFKLIVRAGGHPRSEIKRAFLAADDDIGIQDYRHLSAGRLSAFRAAARSRCQATASSSDSSMAARAAARSRPAQTFSLSGTSRATGEPFLSKTKVTF